MTDTFDRLKAALADRYAIERELGSGGMATVYLAEDLKHERKVAVKVLRPELAAALGPERFLREIKTTARLNHPHILTLLESGEADGFLYYVMPFVEGESLRDRLNREKQLPLDDALQFAREVADALSYAHSHDVVHRDIKPENILLEAGHAVIADFGIARAVTAAGGERLTETGVSVGTPHYMSPEQAAGSKELDGRSDVYSLGCVLYEMLGGEPPFTGPTVESIVHQHITVEAPPITNLRAAVPAEIAGTIARTLAKGPADRFTTAQEFGATLLGTTMPDSPAAPSKAIAPMWRTVTVTAATVALVTIGWWAYRTFAAAPEPIEWLAVLPPDNLMRDSAQDFFVDGMHDELISKLAQIAGLEIISRTSAMSYRNTDKTIPEIARELNVDAVIESSVLRFGDSVRVQVQLIDPFPRERHLWNETYDRSLRDVLELLGQLARDVAEEVQAVLTPQQQVRLARASPVDTVAYNLYLQGRFSFNRLTEWDTATELFQQAIDRDSSYAPAWAGLAKSYIWRSGGALASLRPEEAYPKAAAALRKALELDETLAEAHAALGWMRDWAEGDWSGAEREYRRAIQLSPSYAEAHAHYSILLALMGRFDEAFAEIRTAQALDPLSLLINAQVGWIYYWDSQFDRAIEQWQVVVAMDSTFGLAYHNLGLGYRKKGMHVEAVAAAERALLLLGREPSFTAFLGVNYAVAGRTGEALEILEELGERSEREYVPGYFLALLHLALGHRDEALATLESEYARVRVGWLSMLKREWFDWEALHDHPGFQDLVRRLNFPE